jgi:hypothetical protein
MQEPILNSLNVRHPLLKELALGTKFDYLTILEWFSAKNVNLSLHQELILEFV